MSDFNREYTEDQLFVLNDIADEQEKIMQELMDEENISTLNIPKTSPQTHVKDWTRITWRWHHPYYDNIKSLLYHAVCMNGFYYMKKEVVRVYIAWRRFFSNLKIAVVCSISSDFFSLLS